MELCEMNTPNTIVDKTKQWMMNNRWIAPLVIIGVIVIAIGMFTDALDKILKFTEKRVIEEKTTVSLKTTELVSTLNARADQIVKRLDQDIENIDKAALAATQDMSFFSKNTQPYFELDKSNNRFSPFFVESKESEAEIYERVMRETLNINNELRALKAKFRELHKKHIGAILDDQRLLAREYSNQILMLLREEYPRITAQNVGVSPGTYATGYKHTLVNTREITGCRSNLSDVYDADGVLSSSSAPNNQVNKDSSR